MLTRRELLVAPLLLGACGRADVGEDRPLFVADAHPAARSTAASETANSPMLTDDAPKRKIAAICAEGSGFCAAASATCDKFTRIVSPIA